MRISLRHKQHHLAVEVHPEPGGYRVALDGHERFVAAQYSDANTLVLTVDGRRYRVDVAHDACEYSVAIAGEVYRFVPESSTAAEHSVAIVAAPDIIAPMPGKVLEVLVQPGDRIETGDGLLILEAMKMETRLLAEAAGTVTEVRVAAGDMVNGGQILVVLTYDDETAS